MKRKCFIVGVCAMTFLVAGSVWSCGIRNEGGGESPTPTTAVTNFWEKPAPEKFYHFANEEEVLGISGEDLIYIGQHEYEISDFITDMSEDALDLLRDDSLMYYELSLEPEQKENPERDISAEKFWEAIEAVCDRLFGYYDFYYEEDGRKTDGKGWRIIKCRETEKYVECRIRYMRPVIPQGKTSAEPSAREEIYRFVKGYYFDHQTGECIKVGPVTAEWVKWNTDIEMVGYYSPIIYREVRETENTVTVVRYSVGEEITERGVNNRMCLYRSRIMYHKKDHRDYRSVEVVKSVEIEGTEEIYLREAPPV